jgi:superfamily I DNA/RNA helicase
MRLRESIGIKCDDVVAADALVRRASSQIGIEIFELDPDDPLLYGALALLDRDVPAIYVSSRLGRLTGSYVVAHELGHFLLHPAAGDFAASRLVETDMLDSSGRLVGYSPNQRRERDANTFANEFLLPRPLVRRLFLTEKLSASAIANVVGCDEHLLSKQLAAALLMPNTPSPDHEPERIDVGGDVADAACCPGPAIVLGGPGTGKTAALLQRLRFLTGACRALPQNVLVLTYGRAAATDLILSIRRLFDRGCAPWVGTFHALANEIIQRFGEKNDETPSKNLIEQAVIVLRSVPQARALMHAEYGNVLLDEFQDLDSEMIDLAFALAADGGHGLWAVGDPTQSIYRFRQSSPDITGAFLEKYPNATVQRLTRNVRSRSEIVSVASAVAGTPESQSAALAPVRGTGGPGTVNVAVADGENAEFDGIARFLLSAKNMPGASYRQMAVLCETNAQSAAVCGALSARTIPCVGSASVWDQPAVKDVMAIAELAAGGPPPLLLRAGQLGPYDIPRPVLVELIRKADVDHVTSGADALGLPEYGDVHGIALLRDHILSLAALTSFPHVLLESVLFETTAYVRHMPMALDRTASTIQRLYLQALLWMSMDFEASGSGGNADSSAMHEFWKSHTQEYEAPMPLGRDEWQKIDAVRVMTVHASKGLEFDTVAIPGLKRRDHRDSRDKSILMFVAISRARDRLLLSHACEPSHVPIEDRDDMLQALRRWCAENGTAEYLWHSNPVADPLHNDKLLLDAPISSARLEGIMDCPRRHAYATLDQLPDENMQSGRWHAIVRSVLRDAHADWRRRGGQRPTIDTMMNVLEERVAANWYENQWGNIVGILRQGNSLLSTAMARLPESAEPYRAATLQATMSHFAIQVEVDAMWMERDTGNLVIVTYNPSPLPLASHLANRLALHHLAADQSCLDHRVEVHHLQDSTVETVPNSQPWLSRSLGKYEEPLRCIADSAYPAKPCEACHQCAFRPICPS